MAIGFSIDVVDVDRSSDLFCDLFRVTLFRTSDSRIERLEFIFFIIVGRVRRRIELISFAFVHRSQELWGECREQVAICTYIVGRCAYSDKRGTEQGDLSSAMPQFLITALGSYGDVH